MNASKVEDQARALIRGMIPLVEAGHVFERDGNTYRSVLIGSVFSVMPSGKYYTPFACSNLTPCPACGGEGVQYRKRSKARKLRQVVRQSYRLSGHLIKHHGFYCEKAWPSHAAARLAALRDMAAYLSPKHTCGHCDGVGSREAALDDAFLEAMENEAEKHDCFIESGEGDPCDIFLSKMMEEVDGKDD